MTFETQLVMTSNLSLLKIIKLSCFLMRQGTLRSFNVPETCNLKIAVGNKKHKDILCITNSRYLFIYVIDSRLINIENKKIIKIF